MSKAPIKRSQCDWWDSLLIFDRSFWFKIWLVKHGGENKIFGKVSNDNLVILTYRHCKFFNLLNCDHLKCEICARILPAEQTRKLLDCISGGSFGVKWWKLRCRKVEKCGRTHLRSNNHFWKFEVWHLISSCTFNIHVSRELTKQWWKWNYS